MLNSSRVLLGLALASTATVAAAQEAKAPWRYRVTLGAALVPSYPGADDAGIAPLVGVVRVRGDRPFAFAAPDDGAGISLTGSDSVQIGPVIGFEGKRKLQDTSGLAPEVKFTIEAGGYISYAPVPSLRLRLEARKGVNGHKGVIGVVGADYVARDGDNWLFSIGPRLTWSNARYQRAYFGVPAGSALPAYSPGSGLQAVGGITSIRHELGGRFGIFAYGKYDRLIEDAGRSPLVRTVGSRNQYSGGVGLSYTFGG